MFIIPSIISANITIPEILLESAIETDRLQSTHYWNATPQNPIQNVYEGNPFVRNLSVFQFHAAVSFSKYMIRFSDEYLCKQFSKKLIIISAIIETSVILWNDYVHREYSGFPRSIVISYTWHF